MCKTNKKKQSKNCQFIKKKRKVTTAKICEGCLRNVVPRKNESKFALKESVKKVTRTEKYIVKL